MTQGQPIATTPLTTSATFLVFTIPHTEPSLATARKVLSTIPSLTKNISIRDPTANLTCIVGIGSSIWTPLLTTTLKNLPRPSELHPFQTVQGPKHTAISTPGDILLHIRSSRRDLNFELEWQITRTLRSGNPSSSGNNGHSEIHLEDRTEGFRYFDARDLLGFIDGTANPVSESGIHAATLLPASSESDVDSDHYGNGNDNANNAGKKSAKSLAGGSYAIVQKYKHDLDSWRALSTEQQECIIGRTKLDNIELDDDADAGKQKAHKTLATIIDAAGENEYEIFRDNMPFGSPSEGEFGTYFIAYTRRLWVVEKMMERMFLGDPPGLHDRILDYSTPVTRCTFFVPSIDILESLGDG